MRSHLDSQKFLAGYEMAAVKVECKLAERQQWHDLALSITGQMGGERVQSSGAKDKMAAAVGRCVEMEDEIMRLVDGLAKKQTQIIHAMDQMENPTEYKVLHLRYIQMKELKDIADIFHQTYDWTTTVHGRVRTALQEILDEEKR